MSVVVVEQVSKRFGSAQALSAVSLEVGDRQIAIVFGPHGSGKTTLLRIVAGTERPDSGRVLIAGRDVTDLHPHRRPVATAPQNDALFPHLTIGENIAFGLRMRNARRDRVKNRVARIADLLEIGQFLGHFPRQVSAGERKLASMARALAVEPDILLLDDPIIRPGLKTFLVESRITTLCAMRDPARAPGFADVAHAVSEEAASQ